MESYFSKDAPPTPQFWGSFLKIPPNATGGGLGGQLRNSCYVNFTYLRVLDELRGFCKLFFLVRTRPDFHPVSLGI